MKLKKKYAMGCLIIFYEINMFAEDFVDGILNMLTDIENPENIILDLHFSTEEYLERMTKDPNYFIDRFRKALEPLRETGIKLHIVNDYSPTTYMEYDGREPMSIARYRREFNNRWVNNVDYLMWLETDSFFPAQTFEIIERIDKNVITKKHVITWGYRKLWDDSFKILEHPKFTDKVFQDNEDWTLHNEASEKCYMSLQRLNEINNETEEPDVIILNKPKFDGSAVVFSSDLIKSGVNIPPALLLCGEDTGMSRMCERIMGNNYVQYHVKNILRCHNRRHPKKRNFVVDEYNPCGFCGIGDKGDWWQKLSAMSKDNLDHLFDPNFKFHTFKDFFEKMKS